MLWTKEPPGMGYPIIPSCDEGVLYVVLRLLILLVGLSKAGSTPKNSIFYTSRLGTSFLQFTCSLLMPPIKGVSCHLEVVVSEDQCRHSTGTGSS